MKVLIMKLNHLKTTSLVLLVLGACMKENPVHAAFALPSGSTSPGHGISNVLSGSIANGGFFQQTTTNWINSGAPVKPYWLTNQIALPTCDSISVARLVATVWGGNANYSAEMSVTVNGTTLAAANPLVFGTPADTNAVFNSHAASVYGSGSGVWLVSLPVSQELLHRDGSTNSIVITLNSSDGFDGRIHHVTLLALYQDHNLPGTLDYVIAEGSGDIFKTPSGMQSSRRDVLLAPVRPDGANSAVLSVLYTYGDTSQNDRLYFNGMQMGGDNIARWDTSIAGYGPGIASFDVLECLTVSNVVSFSVGADVPATQETSLRPQIVTLAVSRSTVSAPPALILGGAGNITWTTNSAGFSLKSATQLTSGEWNPVTNAPVITGDQFTVTVETTDTARFYRLEKGK